MAPSADDCRDRFRPEERKIPRREETRRLLRIVAPAVVELCGAGVAVACCLLHVFEPRAVFERRGDEGRPHRMRQILSIEPNLLRKLPYHAVNDSQSVNQRPSIARVPTAPVFCVFFSD